MQIRYTPPAGFDGTDSFSYRVTNPDGSFAIATVTVDVSSGTLTVVNDHLDITVGVPFAMQLSANDDLAGVNVTYTWMGDLPEGMVFASDGLVSGTVDVESSGSIAVVATSVGGASSGGTFSWTARLPEQSDAWLSPALVSDDATTDAERVSRAMNILADWRGSFAITASDLDDLA